MLSEGNGAPRPPETPCLELPGLFLQLLADAYQLADNLLQPQLAAPWARQAGFLHTGCVWTDPGDKAVWGLFWAIADSLQAFPGGLAMSQVLGQLQATRWGSGAGQVGGSGHLQ